MRMHTKTWPVFLASVLAVSAFVLSPDATAQPTSLRYKVDPSWPKRPAEMKWGSMGGVAVDAKDQVWVFTRAAPPIQVYDAKGKLVRAWGKGAVGSAHYIKFGPQGNVWLADIGQHVVMQFTPQGKLLKTLGTRGKSGCDEKCMNKPTDMAIAPDGQVFVTDGYGNDRIVHFDKNGKFVKAWGKRGKAPGEFDLPHGIAMDSKGTLYVADRNNARVQVFDQSGKFLTQWDTVMIPWGLWITKDDVIWAAGSSIMPRPKKGRWRGLPPKDQIVVQFNTSGKVLARLVIPKGADGKERPGEVNWLHAAVPDSKGNLYVGDIRGKKAQKLVKQD